MNPIHIAPSIIAADPLAIGAAVQTVAAGGADALHVDVMDGQFVPNLTLGPAVVQALRKATTLPLDVHLMVDAPERYLETFAEAGAAGLTVHVEATRHLHRTLQAIRALKKTGRRRAQPGDAGVGRSRRSSATSTSCWSCR